MARVLIVDDNQTNLDLMVYLLRAFGHSATGATDGISGFEAATTQEYDLILTDILMPGIDGYEFARRFRERPNVRDTQLVAVTALAMVGDRERVLASGFDGYIAKPIDPQRFVSEVDAYLPANLRSRGAESPFASPASPASAEEPGGPIALLVDDVAVNRDVLRGALEPFGYRIREAHDAPSAIARCMAERPDVILCDLHMPGGDGFTLLTALKTHYALRDVPVLLLSSTSRKTAEKQRALELGAIKFLERPIDPRQLLTEVKEALKGEARAKNLDR